MLFVLRFLLITISLPACAIKCLSMCMSVHLCVCFLQISHPIFQCLAPNEAVVMATRRLIDNYCYQHSGGEAVGLLGLCEVGCRVHALNRDLGYNSLFQIQIHTR